MILILLHIDCPIKWTLNFFGLTLIKRLENQDGLHSVYIIHLAPNSSNALSLDTLFDIATALDVAPQEFLAFED